MNVVEMTVDELARRVGSSQYFSPRAPAYVELVRRAREHDEPDVVGYAWGVSHGAALVLVVVLLVLFWAL